MIYKSQLSVDGRRLVETMQAVNFGRLELLSIQAGCPKFTGSTKVIREVKLGSQCGKRPELALTDFVLCSKLEELFAEMRMIGDGVITAIEVQNGLPFRFSVLEVVST